ncbi:MAG TPA: M3 family oligoendopeptidase [Acidobacteriota bacterium]|nr:M3 family oligoendopeptidase [Acidobacteriota bacterium]
MGQQAMTVEKTGAEEIRWDLSDLYESISELEQALPRIEKEAEQFQKKHKGKLASYDAAEMAQALQEYEQVHDQAGRAYSFSYLDWTTKTGDAAKGATLQKVRESYNRVSQTLLFFELEWIALPDEKAEQLLQSPALNGYRHYLVLQRRLKEHVLSEAEEKILAEKSVTGRSAWNRFFDETLGTARFTLQGEEMGEQEVLAKLHDSDRDLRRQAALSLTEGLQRTLRETTFVFNTLVADKASDDRLRNYPHWLASRNLANQVSDEAVENLIGVVTSRYDLVARFYNLKKRLLGYDELFDYDRYAPIVQSDRRYDWAEARTVVLEAYRAFHPEMARVAEMFFDKDWIDAPVGRSKRGGAYSHSTVPSAHPYVFLNYTGRDRDVQTLAHELGHGVHQYLAREQGILHCDTPLTMAETASVFGEMLVFESLRRKEENTANELAMLVGKIDDSMATVFRQVSMNRFEARLHTARREDGELSSERISELWIEAQGQMFQGSVTLLDHYSIWWSYIPHFIHTPGYVYAYAFGELMVMALFARYREEGESFAPKYLELLTAGGSDWPYELAGKVGVDLRDPDFWAQGLAAIEALIDKAEELADELA